MALDESTGSMRASTNPFESLTQSAGEMADAVPVVNSRAAVVAVAMDRTRKANLRMDFPRYRWGHSHAAKVTAAGIAMTITRPMSQDDLARELRNAGCSSATKRLVQRWESGTTRTPRPSHASALEKVLGLPIETLGFDMMSRVRDDGYGGHDVEPSNNGAADEQRPQPRARPNPGNYSGIWLSHYQYYSSGREKTFSTGHYVVALQHGSSLSVRSLPGSAPSTMSMDLTLDGSVATGTWTEDTNPNGYYRGTRYHGAIQLLIEPTGARL
ncbi:XRE family transcriptional regulator [Nocardia sp. CC227C]|uniref:helix-turn-helix domain-containing protein n=1 Tax=Nocardia sp. CC227C TaxID=3044562 RepID=UPI00278C7FED|nr:XRE family transcriptional regulator [Nocardia sp. CC227C]